MKRGVKVKNVREETGEKLLQNYGKGMGRGTTSTAFPSVISLSVSTSVFCFVRIAFDLLIQHLSPLPSLHFLSSFFLHFFLFYNTIHRKKEVDSRHYRWNFIIENFPQKHDAGALRTQAKRLLSVRGMGR